jgi:broad specificity phosphatase PhoE
MSLGDLDGIEFGRWASQYPDFYRAWQSAPASLRVPGGETLQEVQRRAIETLNRASQLYPSGSTLLFCSHNFVNRTLLCHALKIPLDRYREISQHAGALNILHQREGQLRAEVVDDLSHLQKFIRCIFDFACPK